MLVVKLKLQIIAKIASIEDQIILERIIKFIETEEYLAADELSDEDSLAVKKCVSEVRDGRLLTAMLAESMISELLKRRKYSRPK
jgi:hypothetical protein